MSFLERALILGLGVTGEAVAEALVRRGVTVVVVEDHPRPAHRRTAESLGVRLVEAPPVEQLRRLLDEADVLLPSPGVPEQHRAFSLAADSSVPVESEFDLAARWDARPVVAITGTDGKTTVTTLVTAMLEASGVAAVAAGNTELPLVRAIDDVRPEVFVVEASSFRLGHTRRFSPRVATWLNFGADHQDAHASLVGYEQAKARIWADLGPEAVVVANADDPVVMSHVPAGARVVTFGLGAEADYCVVDGGLRAGSAALLPVADLPRRLPHDLANALAAAATARAAGADTEAIVDVLRDFRGLPHRVEEVGELGGVRYVDDSKATAPHATLAALEGFDSVVLLAGGRNKGLDLGALRAGRERLRAVVAIGEAAVEVEQAFRGLRPVRSAPSMEAAVEVAAELARPGDVVLLSPACASFDWYRSYGERGDAFAAAVRRRAATAPTAPTGRARP